MHDPVTAEIDFPALEEAIGQWWASEGIPARTLRQREGSPEFVFYEGPPYANAPPGVHSVLPRVIKDVYTRYRTMKGFYVPRMAGWDCHGLPAEVEVEKKLGFETKREILDYGVERFNHLCRTSVSEYITDYIRFSERIAFWLDYEDAYQTMDNPYIESVWWSLAELHRKGLLFESDRVAPYCPRCETPLSDHELGQEDVYREVSDPGVTLALPLEDATDELEGAALAVWTTTPWTLLANLAAAVHPEVTYVVVDHGGRRLVAAEALASSALGTEGPPLATLPGSRLVGMRYRPPFDYARHAYETRGDRDSLDRAWRVLAGDFVNVEEGTGIVHMAGAFGADDLEAVRGAGIAVYNPLDASGRYDATVPDFEGTFIKDADPRIVERLDAAGVLLRSEPYLHRYPHCWRCDQPLLNYALTSWYVRTTAYKERMLEENRRVQWVPEHIGRGRYGNWLEGNVDWSLSRFRFWGTPLPIWRCPQGHDVAVGSVAELSELAGANLEHLDLHRPHVDEVVFDCRECGEEARRVTDVIDVWYDSGAMPFAQFGYPHRNAELFERRFPADFIAEGLDQTRGWFYSLMAESVALFDRNAYRSVICHGLILDEEGKKMSKSRSIADPWRVFETYGSDALRFFYLSAGNPADNRRLSDTSLRQVVRGPFLTLWNVYRLYVLYANIDGFDPNSWTPTSPSLRPAIDRWILAELQAVVSEVDEALESYDSLSASRAIATFVDDLSNWYVRRSRRRFWRSASDDTERADKTDAYWTLWTCLVEVTKLLAPFAPFLAESIYRNLVCSVNPEATPSVHLTDFPTADPDVMDVALSVGMAAVRELASLGRAARTEARVKVRQPLRQAVVIVPHEDIEAVADLAELLAEELNVGSVVFAEEVSTLVRSTLKPNFRTAGPELGDRVRDLAAALGRMGAEEAEWAAAALERGESIEVALDGGEVLEVGPELVEVRREPAERTAFAYDAPFGISLDLEVTAELRREGLVREFVHQVQNLRREAGLEVTDRIELVAAGPEHVRRAIEEHTDYVATELLAGSVKLESDAPAEARGIDVDGTSVAVVVRKALEPDKTTGDAPEVQRPAEPEKATGDAPEVQRPAEPEKA